jgi:hypothetical protein
MQTSCEPHDISFRFNTVATSFAVTVQNVVLGVGPVREVLQASHFGTLLAAHRAFGVSAGGNEFRTVV